MALLFAEFLNRLERYENMRKERSVYVNIETITHVNTPTELGLGADIHVVGGEIVRVKETPAQVLAAVSELTKYMGRVP